MKRWRKVILFFIIAAVAYGIYVIFRTPDGLEALSKTEESVAIIGLWTAIAGAAAGFLGVLKEIIGLMNADKK